jgi:kynurenine formamidase
MFQLVPEFADDIRKKAGPGDRRGSARWIDAEAIKRGAASIKEGRSVSLSRPIQSAVNALSISRSNYELVATQRREQRLVVSRDQLTIDMHGMVNTHIDGLNHFGLDDTWHDGTPTVLADGMPSIVDWADTGLATRAIFLDIPALRNTRWTEAGAPVTAKDLDQAVAAAGVKFESGDAIILYMGREEYEREHPTYAFVQNYSELRPGIGKDGSRWLAERNVSLVLWDFMEATGPDESPYSVHVLIWARGLILVDNCDMAAARRALSNRREKTGLLTVAPLMLPRATGCPVNPLLVI